MILDVLGVTVAPTSSKSLCVQWHSMGHFVFSKVGHDLLVNYYRNGPRTLVVPRGSENTRNRVEFIQSRKGIKVEILREEVIYLGQISTYPEQIDCFRYIKSCYQYNKITLDVSFSLRKRW
ncbi:hypothetical protein Dimus_011707 [Dionaea muscipula]